MHPSVLQDTYDPPVYITHVLEDRPAGKADYLEEKLALQDLARHMANDPAEVLPRFVDLAMEMTGGIAAGVSILENETVPGVFRWQYLRGALSRFDGATTPRDFSPCGVTLDQMAPVLTSHSERMYDWISDADIEVPEVLLVPLVLGNNTALGTLWIVSDQEEHFDSGHSRVVTELAAFVGIALKMVQTEQRLQRALDAQAVLAKQQAELAADQEMLTREMSHRVQNAFAVIESMIQISRKGAATSDDLSEILSGRLQALNQAHRLIRRDTDEASGKSVSDFAMLLRVIAQPYDGTRGEPRFSVEGPPVTCAERAVSGLALVFHELTTNSAKYGALGSVTGKIEVKWRLEGSRVVVRWQERGGPAISAPPSESGFGSALIRATIARQFDGTIDQEWLTTGLCVTVSLSSERLAA